MAPRGIRPTQALVRAAIFDALAGQVEGATVLDLFAGSGALGIEALSRGAARAVFVERSQPATAAVIHNLQSVGLSDRARVVRADVTRWLRSNPDEVADADLVILDPPYADQVLTPALKLLDQLAADRALVVVEHAQRGTLPSLERLQAVRTRRYGDSAVTVLRVAEAGPES